MRRNGPWRLARSIHAAHGLFMCYAPWVWQMQHIFDQIFTLLAGVVRQAGRSLRTGQVQSGWGVLQAGQPRNGDLKSVGDFIYGTVRDAGAFLSMSGSFLCKVGCYNARKIQADTKHKIPFQAGAYRHGRCCSNSCRGSTSICFFTSQNSL